MHAIGAAHNILSAMIDNHLYWDNELADSDAYHGAGLSISTIVRFVISQWGLAGLPTALPAKRLRHYGCLRNHGNFLPCKFAGISNGASAIIVGQTRRREAVTAKDLKADGAMTVLLKDALMPNLVQTLENNPAFVHGGPFANIAHGCNSVMATEAALHLSDYVITEAGFGADLGAEKFFDIKCRKAGLKPDATVIVATIRALKMHGGVKRDELNTENVGAVRLGIANLKRHIENVKKFGVPPVIAINRFSGDTDAEIAAVASDAAEAGAEVVECTHWSDDPAGRGIGAIETRK